MKDFEISSLVFLKKNPTTSLEVVETILSNLESNSAILSAVKVVSENPDWVHTEMYEVLLKRKSISDIQAGKLVSEFMSACQERHSAWWVLADFDEEYAQIFKLRCELAEKAKLAR